jgi:hypothetical protein
MLLRNFSSLLGGTYYRYLTVTEAAGHCNDLHEEPSPLRIAVYLPVDLGLAH